MEISHKSHIRKNKQGVCGEDGRHVLFVTEAYNSKQ